MWAWMGKQPVSSVYNLLIGVTWKKSFLDRTWGIGSSGELVDWGLGLVELTPWRFYTRFSMMVDSAEGKYLVVLAIVSPGHDEYFPVLMSFIHVERTEYPAAAWNYLIKSSTIGRS